MARTSNSHDRPAFLSWLLAIAPGQVLDSGDHLRIAHETGEYSALWWRTPGNSPYPALDALSFYRDFDGADLFGSTFKLCSIFAPKWFGKVLLVADVPSLIKDLDEGGISFPESATPFMSGTQWEYAIAHELGRYSSTTSSATSSRGGTLRSSMSSKSGST